MGKKKIPNSTYKSMIITDPTCLQKVIWNYLNKILWQLKKGLQWVNNLLLTQWVSR